jgi:hypothetical protein
MNRPYRSIHLERESERIVFEHSYYAVRIIELISNFLNLGSFSDLLISKLALIDYIEDQIVETPEQIYLNLTYTTNSELILENTYYMIYLLKALNIYCLDSQKIHNYLIANINYQNIKNVYYCYKISQLIDVEFDFDFDLTQNLIQELYCEEVNEFYINTVHAKIDSEVILWISEMALDHKLEIEYYYTESLKLGSLNTMYCHFRNIMFDDFGPATTAQFESDALGVIDLERQTNGSYAMDFLIPEDPECYPCIDGELIIRYRSRILGTYPVHLETQLAQSINHRLERNTKKIFFEVNISRKLNSIFQPVFNSTVYVDIFQNNRYFDTKNFSRKDYTNYSRFTLNYDYNANYSTFYNITLIDAYHPNGLILFDYEIGYQAEPFTLKLNGPILAFIALGISTGSVLGSAKVGQKIKRRKSEKQKAESDENSEDEREENKKQEKINNSAQDQLEVAQKTVFNTWDS